MPAKRKPTTSAPAWFYAGWHRKTIKTEDGATSIMELMCLRPEELATWKRAKARRVTAALRAEAARHKD